MRWTIQYILIFLPFFSQGQDFFKHVGYGANKVGFYSTILTDSTRFWDAEKDIKREIQLHVWFPTGEHKDRSLYADYFEFVGKQNNYKAVKNPAATGERIHFYPARHFEADSFALEKLKKWKMRASLGVDFPSGKHPTIFFSQGASGHPINNVTLFELLASHGFVVISFPTKPPDNKTTFRDDIKKGLQHQGEDLKFIYNYVMKAFSWISARETHFMGVSSGSLSSYFAIRDLGLKPQSFVSLDGSITSAIMEQFMDNFTLPLFDCKVLITARNLENLNTKMLEKYFQENSEEYLI